MNFALVYENVVIYGTVVILWLIEGKLLPNWVNKVHVAVCMILQTEKTGVKSVFFLSLLFKL